MGAKQSKRSVDISGKEAENAGEVAAAGAGGEGRVEALADADAGVKPQLNGDAHIQPPLEISDKEKQLDSGTPENEKDATTEKEGKEEQNGEKEPTPVTNGDSEQKEENGESVPTPEDGKKPKKEKVKKKWSLRSISFSRKDKPKQEKKSKDEEPKTNGEPEKVPEEAAEATPESVENKIAEVAQPIVETKEEKTPETPVTEPLTNGSSTPDSPKPELAADPPAAAEPAPVAAPSSRARARTRHTRTRTRRRQRHDARTAPGQRPLARRAQTLGARGARRAGQPARAGAGQHRGLAAPPPHPAPPPLPASPPPSCVASFAATTMAPELLHAEPVSPAAPEHLHETSAEARQTDNTNLVVTQISPPLKETAPAPVTANEDGDCEAPSASEIIDAPEEIKPESEMIKPEPEAINREPKAIKTEETLANERVVADSIKTPVESVEIAEIPKAEPEIESEVVDPPSVDSDAPVPNVNGNDSIKTESPAAERANGIDDVAAVEPGSETDEPSEPASCGEELPPPPPEDELPAPVVSNGHHDTDDIPDDAEQKILKSKKVDALGNIVAEVECNGNGDAESPAPASESGSLPPPPAEPAAADQEPLPIADKIADLIPEIPTIPELKTETESAVAVAD
ncbi:LOW QUALITY PROTEIN: cell surface glycoprotein 1-like [Leguminivora glycinivorella]|uniref:LOW QUALITY PROTEIN: cell surface glycoprotein 1-like n=1 Tax=Leguminivora glycinivorella TaxID=1035111 RepID=UPI00200FFCC3|nr:LOW QUALITY PROTEIN: cell surface glycoprotein 1-like [Leguminivora glycinivorella]